MTDNVLQTLQQLIQDVIAPDVRELKVRMTALEKQFDAAEKQNEARFDALHDQQDANFKAIMAAIGESKARTELDKLYAALEAAVRQSNPAH